MLCRGAVVTLGGVEIRIDVQERLPLAGRVRVDGRAPARFEGWLALLAILDRVVEAGLASAADGFGGEFDAGGEAELAQRAGDVSAHGAPG